MKYPTISQYMPWQMRQEFFRRVYLSKPRRSWITRLQKRYVFSMFGENKSAAKSYDFSGA